MSESAQPTGDAVPAPGEPIPDAVAPAPAPPAAPTRLEPVAAPERLAAVDVLRGVALLGILVMNIYAFAMPTMAYMNPLVWGGNTGADMWTWIVTHLLFDQKMMTIFSMLFGAGLVLLDQRSAARGAKLGGVFYRRVLVLLGFGLLHAYLLWYGDILYNYALCGMLLFLFRRVRPRWLIAVGAAAIVAAALTYSATGGFFMLARKTAHEAAAARAAGRTPTEFQQAMEKTWPELQLEFEPTPAELQRQIQVYRGSWVGIFLDRLPLVLQIQIFMTLMVLTWRLGGIMLIGMALMKLEVFSARRSPAFYHRLMLAGYGLGFPLVGLGMWDLFRTRFDFIHSFLVAGHFNGVGSLLVALGHVGLVMRLYQAGFWPALQARLAAVGRMALTNYLAQTIIATTIFYGYGFGLFGSVSRFPLMGFVVAIWAVQLWYSPLWLRHFRFGPAEWLWRWLTYGRRPPLRLEVDS
ncbi:MAG TPA: DUF418 domain-containing protein [Acidobacteriota bacterium]|nr:DUF418 domain-containing protein [Acidobacteriota bacterium]HQM65026.1 DUF418 domain-containing protein [Acidobacteriota bacterium]